MIRFCILLLLVLTAGQVSSQVNFLFVPEVYGRTVDGLGVFQVQNLTGQPRRGQVTISVQENISKTKVLSITSPVISIATGMSPFPVNAYANSVFKFANTPLAAIASQTRNFPPGEYTYCFSWAGADKDGEENCFDANIQPVVPISLLNPADGDHICQKRPPLSWQPPVPFPAAMRFRLQLVEKKQGSDVEALLMNAPLVLMDNIPTTTVNYPGYAPDLKEGSTYVWQVIAYLNGVIMSRSEIWEFTVQCQDPVKPAPSDSYRELKTLENGNYYYGTGWLKFSYLNRYNIRKLAYEIDETGNGAAKVKNLPDIVLTPGLNKIDLNLADFDLQEGKHYLLRVYPFNEPPVTVRFLYTQNNPMNP